MNFINFQSMKVAYSDNGLSLKISPTCDRKKTYRVVQILYVNCVLKTAAAGSGCLLVIT